MAEIVLQTTIPDNTVLQQRIIAAFHGMANKQISVNSQNAHIDLRYTEIQDGETQKQYAERILKALGKMLITLYEIDKDYTERYVPAVQAITQPGSDIPEDILL